jgi:hypothetical protein
VGNVHTGTDRTVSTAESLVQLEDQSLQLVPNSSDYPTSISTTKTIHHERRVVDGLHQSYCSSEGFQADDAFSILLSRGILSIKRITSLLESFKAKTNYFPFVIIPENVSVLSMLRDRPFLVLSTLAAASSTDRPLQKLLEHELKVSLCKRVFFDNEKSLDLLQGLLVYLAWSVSDVKSLLK